MSTPMESSATPPQFTLGDLLKFIIRNRGTRAFVNCSYRKIMEELLRASANGSLYTIAEDNKITGMIIAYVNPSNDVEI